MTFLDTNLPICVKNFCFSALVVSFSDIFFTLIFKNLHLCLIVIIFHSASIVMEKIFRIMKKKQIELTSREIEVLKLVVLGASNKDIGEKLFITHHTVKAHLTQIYKKLGVTNRTSAAIKAKDSNYGGIKYG